MHGLFDIDDTLTKYGSHAMDRLFAGNFLFPVMADLAEAHGMERAEAERRIHAELDVNRFWDYPDFSRALGLSWEETLPSLRRWHCENIHALPDSVRLVRRLVRDYNFRGSDAGETMAMWANVRYGEKLYISPFKDKADFQFDTAAPYEPAVFNRTATELFKSVPEGIERFEELRAVLPALQLFGEIDESLVAPDALIREFIGGGIYEY